MAEVYYHEMVITLLEWFFFLQNFFIVYDFFFVSVNKNILKYSGVLV